MRLAEEAVDARLEEAERERPARAVARRQRRVRLGDGAPPERGHRAAPAVHRREAGERRRHPPREPEEGLHDELPEERRGSGREEVEEVQPAGEREVPALGGGERRPEVRDRGEDGAAAGEAARGRPDLGRPLEERPEDEASAGVGHDVEEERLLPRERLREHPGVLLRRPAEGEVVEPEDPPAVEGRERLEETAPSRDRRRRRRCARRCRGGEGGSVPAEGRGGRATRPRASPRRDLRG